MDYSMNYLILLFSCFYLVGCLEEEEKTKHKPEDFGAKSSVEDTQKLLGEIDNQEKKKNPFSLTKVADEVTGNGNKNFSLTPVADEGKNRALYTIKNDLIAWWTFDRDSKDASGNNRHAEPKNEFSFVKGKIGNAIRVVGKPGGSSQGGHVLLPFLDWLENGAFSFSLWVKEEEILSNHGEHYLAYGTICHITHTKMKSFGTYVFNFGNDHSYEKNLNWNEWNMYTVTYDTRTKVGFLNGKEVTRENTLDPTTVGWKNEKYKINGKLTPLGETVKRNYRKAALGRHWWSDNTAGNSSRFVGSFDDVRIYNRNLTAEEIIALYNL
jgi:hypothetical protein